MCYRSYVNSVHTACTATYRYLYYLSYGKVLLQIVRYSSGGQLHVRNLVSTGSGNLHVNVNVLN